MFYLSSNKNSNKSILLRFSFRRTHVKESTNFSHTPHTSHISQTRNLQPQTLNHFPYVPLSPKL